MQPTSASGPKQAAGIVFAMAEEQADRPASGRGHATNPTGAPHPTGAGPELHGQTDAGYATGADPAFGPAIHGESPAAHPDTPPPRRSGAARWLLPVLVAGAVASLAVLAVMFTVVGSAPAPQIGAEVLDPAIGGEPDSSVGPTANVDHWHKAFGVYLCGDWLIEPQETTDIGGLHSHQDGLLHIHPFLPETEGTGATLSRFMESFAYTLTDRSFTDDLGNTVTEGESDCDGEPARLAVAIWDAAVGEVPSGAPDRIVTDGLADVIFERDGGAIAITFVADGAELSVPPWSERLLAVAPASAVEDDGTMEAAPRRPVDRSIMVWA